MDKNHIRDNIIRITSEVQELAARSGQGVNVMAVSKTYPLEYVEAAKREGILLFGENRVQETGQKFYGSDDVATDQEKAHIRDEIELHLIGTLQKNKVKKALRYFDCIESIDSQSLVDECHNILARLEESRLEGKKLEEGKLEGVSEKKIFLQVTCSDYDYKHGFKEYDILSEAVHSIIDKKLLIIQGVMTIAPFTHDEKIVRGAFAKTREWKNRLEHDFHLTHLELSMGMSGNYTWAIEEGTNIVRLGTAIFGARNYV